MKKVMCLFLYILSILITSCETSTEPLSSSQVPVNIMTLFVGEQASIDIQLTQPVPPDIYPNIYDQNEWISPYCNLYIEFKDTSRTKLTISFYATNLTPAPLSGTFKIALGANILFQPITINIVDFYYASRLENNTNDTIKLKSGISFLLQLTFKDTAGRIVSRNQIERLLNHGARGDIIFPYPFFSDDMIFSSYVYRDSTSYYYLFSTLPNVYFSTQDTGQYFNVLVSNKTFKIPIKLVN